MSSDGIRSGNPLFVFVVGVFGLFPVVLKVELQQLAAVRAGGLSLFQHVGIDADDVAAGRAADLIDVAVLKVLRAALVAVALVVEVVVVLFERTEVLVDRLDLAR